MKALRRLRADSRGDDGGRRRLSCCSRLSVMQAARWPAAGFCSLSVVTWVGAFTAVFAALIAVAQNDIKRILAYSTVFAVGYMMAGLGMAAWPWECSPDHACILQGLLFMGAGSVIHAATKSRIFGKMGGLWSKMPWTFGTYAIGMLGFAGFPCCSPASGRRTGFSKPRRAGTSRAGHFICSVFGALLTAFYMTRQVSYVFFGKSRGENNAHESGR